MMHLRNSGKSFQTAFWKCRPKAGLQICQFSENPRIFQGIFECSWQVAYLRRLKQPALLQRSLQLTQFRRGLFIDFVAAPLYANNWMLLSPYPL